MDKLLIAAAIITLIATAYWVAFALNAYGTFHEYDDLAIFSHNMWLDIHYPGLSHGLQYTVFGNHISPDLLFMLPIFYLYQSSVTLLILQVIILSITSLAVYMIARDLLGNRKIAFAIFLAFVLNPGMHGMMTYDFHAESLITLFYILTFYFYIRQRKWPFIASALLLLGTIEEAPFLGIALGMGLLFYELVYNRKSAVFMNRIKLAGILLLMSIVVLGIYDGVTLSLLHSYTAGSYATMPTYLKVLPYVPHFIATLTGSSHISSPIPAGLGQYIGYSLVAGILFLSIAVLFDPIVTLLLTSPYIAEIYLMGNYNFAFIFNQYFGFVMGPALVAGMIGIMLLQQKKGWVYHVLSFGKGKARTERDMLHKQLMAAFVVSLIVINAFILLLYPGFVYSKNVNNLPQDFLFQVSPAQHAYEQQVYSMMALIPGNASVIVPFFVAAHMINRQYLEDTAYTMDKWYFTPQYILVDPNLNVSLNAQVGLGELYNFSKENNYTLYAQNGTAQLYVHN